MCCVAILRWYDSCLLFCFFFIIRRLSRSTLFPYTTLFRSSINFVAPGTRSNQTVLVLDRWQNKGDITDIQKFSTTGAAVRSEEHTSELQSQSKLVCRLLLEKKNPKYLTPPS